MKIITNDQIACVRNACNTMNEIVNLHINEATKYAHECEDEDVEKKMWSNYSYELAYHSGFNQAIEIINHEFKLDLPYIEV